MQLLRSVASPTRKATMTQPKSRQACPADMLVETSTRCQQECFLLPSAGCEIRVLYERAAIVICSRYRDEVCMFQLKP